MFDTLMNYDDLDAYNGNTEHNSWVDFEYHESTGELSVLFDDTNIDGYINNLNDWD